MVKSGKIVPESVEAEFDEFVGVSSYCGIKGQAVTIYRDKNKRKEPKIKTDSNGREYVEVKSLLASRVSAYIPDLDVGITDQEAQDMMGRTMGWSEYFGTFVVEELLEQLAEQSFTGLDSNIPFIFTYFYLRLYADGTVDAGFPVREAASGFVTKGEITNQTTGSFSAAPEHHIYINGALDEEYIPDPRSFLITWLEHPYIPTILGLGGFVLMSDALLDWCENASEQDIDGLAELFEEDEEASEYYIGRE